jgi:hypothetical protein
LTDQRRAGGETIAVSDVEGVEAEAKTEHEILIEGEEGTNIANATANAAQGQERGIDDITLCLVHGVEKGREMIIMSPRGETIDEIEVVRLNGVRSIDGVMNSTIDTSEDSKA